MSEPSPYGESRRQERLHLRLRKLQWRTAILTWLSYASYYLTRKNFSVAKGSLQTDLSLSLTQLGMIDTAYLVLYALGQFVNGALGDRFGARRMIAFGMIATAICSLAVGFSSSFAGILLFFGINGVFQSTGWPNNVKAMAPWFAASTRGKIMGAWCTCYSVGGLVATVLAGALLVRFGWRWVFRVPAAWVATLGLVILLFLVEKPQDRGLRPPNDGDAVSADSDAPIDSDDESQENVAEPQTGFLAMIREPLVWSLGMAYFGLKLIRYSLLFWLPLYLGKLGYAPDVAAYLSTSFEAGGIVGAIGIGWFSDRYCLNKRAHLLVPTLLALAVALGVYRQVAGLGLIPNALSMAAVGFLLFGPDALISGAAAQDVGGQKSSASAAGIINGIGSLGGMLQGFVTVVVTEIWGWPALFFVFIALTLSSAAALLPMAVRERRASLASEE